MTQEQRFDVAGQVGDYELRKYHACVIAEVSVASDFQGASNAGFQPLFNYIAGSNHTNSKVAMTTPVLQESGTKIETTERPIEFSDEGEHKVGFVMPGHFSKTSELPVPNDSRVTLREIAEELVVIDRFSGNWSHEVYLKRLGKMLAAIESSGYTVAGSPRFARFNPPWTPRFMRRNEIQVPVTRK